MKQFKWYKTQIYNQWKPTNKIFFWLAFIGILLTIFFGVPVYSEYFGDEIKITPDKILLAKNNKNYSPIFYVKNNTDKLINQIWLKLTLNSTDISLKNDDIVVKLISGADRMSLDVPFLDSSSKVDISDYLLGVGGTDSLGNQALYLFRNQLGPKETLQIQIANNFPKKLQGEHFFKVTFLNSSNEPVEAFTNKGGPLEVSPSAIGEKLVVFKNILIMRTTLTP